MDLAELSTELNAWLAENETRLRPDARSLDSLPGQMAHLAEVKRLAYDSGFMRWGWPERVGGLGGSPLARALLGERLTGGGYVDHGVWSTTEVLAPTVITFARPELAAAAVPRLLRGDEVWCQGFSEPGTGSNLAALACRGERSASGWVVTGQKVWTSHAQFADRCLLLVRTGSAESLHRGITALFVDMDSPGITIRPIRAMHGADEFCEVWFDRVEVPFDRTLGEGGQGWQVAMDLLPYERSTALWHRGANLRHWLERLLRDAPDASLAPEEVGSVVAKLYALRARSRSTQHRMAAGEALGPETSVDKVLLASAEQALFDLAASALAGPIVLGDDLPSRQWRSSYLYSRAATIYGGTSEIQRNILARRVLGLDEAP